jgi:hypothetical protein
VPLRHQAIFVQARNLVTTFCKLQQLCSGSQKVLEVQIFASVSPFVAPEQVPLEGRIDVH